MTITVDWALNAKMPSTSSSVCFFRGGRSGARCVCGGGGGGGGQYYRHVPCLKVFRATDSEVGIIML